MEYLLKRGICLIAIMSCIVLVACAPKSTIEYGKSILIKGDPRMNNFTELQPGESMPHERFYDIAPPVIPHSIKDFDLKRKANDCLGCHAEGMELDENHVATKVPKSHYGNDYTGEQTNETVIGIRYNCVQCHVSQIIEKQSE